MTAAGPGATGGRRRVGGLEDEGLLGGAGGHGLSGRHARQISHAVVADPAVALERLVGPPAARTHVVQFLPPAATVTVRHMSSTT